MCVTEVWTYSECGCRYNHSVLCRMNRGISSPVFAPSVLYSTEERLQKRGVDADATTRQVRGRAKLAEPKKCPHHSFVQKTFLNPICDDCLLAEVTSAGQDVGPPLMAPASNASNEDGLVWDSEVKVEIQSQTSIESPSSDAPVIVDSEGADDTDRRILESHVEITVEEDSYSVSAEDPSSPLLASSQTGGSSPSSSLMTSPPTSTEKQQKEYRLSPPLRRKRYGLTFHDGFSTDFDDGEDDEDDPLHAIRSPSRGRPAMRGNGNGTGAQRSVTDPITALPPVESKMGRKSLSRMKSFRSISSAFRHTPKSKQQDTLTETVSEKAVPKRSRSRNPFRAFRKRKASHQYTESADTMPILQGHGSRDSLHEPTGSSQDKKTSAPPPRKSSLKHWKPAKDSSRKEIGSLPVRQSLRMEALAPLSPTGSAWSWNKPNDRDESERPTLTVPLEEEEEETPFDAQSVFSDFEVEGTAAFNMENAATPALVVPATPDSFKVNPMRAMIEGIEAFDLAFDLGLDNGFPKKSRPETGLMWDYEDQTPQVQYLGLAITSSEPELVETKQEQPVDRSAITKAGPTEPPSVPLPALPQERYEEVTDVKAAEAGPRQVQPAETSTERSREPSPEDSERIISMYGWSTTDQNKEAEKEDEVVLDVCDVAVVLRRKPVIEEEEAPETEESQIDDEPKEPEQSTTTPPGSPSPAAKALVAKAPRHPPRKSSLKRLTGFNHAHMPFAEFDFPVPRSPLLQQAFETEGSE
ncbi:hypothetical protein EDD36DRAFT_224744 [Exophiala viscosa]|uniref:Uncharacterized protein n=1 Tax=Exophiala viscosa TaxID=2486360 RepID=A0AAN6DZQ9_9EURO|nr:hypothetical protein EDD36DRAFT_224744 [Exophiala viscosa]